MELQTTRNDAAALPSATVVLLRDGAQGLEAFLLQRHAQSEVLGGAYVFPGGKLDAADHALVARLDRPAHALHQAMGEPELAVEAAAALHVAAIRELFEETGVLLADLPPDQVAPAWSRLRAGLALAGLLQGVPCRLAASRLAPWSRWVTPVVGGVVRKRFDTRFFVAAMPPGQTAWHDSHEATASAWLSPRAALEQYWQGTVELAPPQIMTLSHLARYADVATVLQAAAARRPPCIRPHPIAADTGRILCYPGDPEHPEAGRVMPGPTRLAWRNGRFEPDAGLEALLSH